MMKTFSKNLKRLRQAKGLTQEQAAAALGVSTQSISRWECGTTLPDVSMLPGIARLYCVTIDDLYKETSVAYDNYAQRLLGVFEASGKPEDFLRADMEFRKLLDSDEYTAKDLRSYAILHQYMMHHCMERAGGLFDRALERSTADPETYWSTKRQRSYFLWQVGRNQENIDEFLPLVTAGSSEVNDWICLVQAYQLAGDHETALAWAEEAARRFPENASLHIYSGDSCRALKRYDQAFIHWNRALELEPRWQDAAYSMGFCYEELGEYEKARQVWCRVAGELAALGFEAEALFPRSRAEHCGEQLR